MNAVESPVCVCKEDLQTADHITTKCPLVRSLIGYEIKGITEKYNTRRNSDFSVDLINSSKDESLPGLSLVPRNQNLRLRDYLSRQHAITNEMRKIGRETDG